MLTRLKGRQLPAQYRPRRGRHYPCYYAGASARYGQVAQCQRRRYLRHAHLYQSAAGGYILHQKGRQGLRNNERLSVRQPHARQGGLQSGYKGEAFSA